MGAKGVRRAGPIVRMDMRRRRICRVPRFFAWRGAFFPVRGKKTCSARTFMLGHESTLPISFLSASMGRRGVGSPPAPCRRGSVSLGVGGNRMPPVRREDIGRVSPRSHGGIRREGRSVPPAGSAGARGRNFDGGNMR